MRHLTDEQLVEHFLNEEGANRVVVETHLRICSRCEQAYEEIANAMEVRHPEPPARERGYGERVWQSIQELNPELLRPYPAKPKSNGWFTWPRMVLLAACLAGLAAAFFGGSLWEMSRNHPLQAGNTAQAKERVVLLILDDHLERSERLLVQLNHAGGEGGTQDVLQAEARQLLPDNRLYRQTIAENGDPSMSATLDHLERVLQEIANTPDKLNGAEVERIEQEMNTDSLLFQIRVLRARTARPEQKLDSRKGATI